MLFEIFCECGVTATTGKAAYNSRGVITFSIDITNRIKR